MKIKDSYSKGFSFLNKGSLKIKISIRNHGHISFIFITKGYKKKQSFKILNTS